MNAHLFALQRGTALALAVLVLVHLAMIVVAVQDGLTADEILGRTRGSTWWALFYGLFVLMAAVHGSIGLRSIVMEWLRLHEWTANAVAWITAAALLATGLRAVWAVTIGGGA